MIRTTQILTLLAFAFTLTQTSLAEDKKSETSDIPKHITAAINHKNRPNNVKARDKTRKPAQVMQLANIKPGQTIADLMTGGVFIMIDHHAEPGSKDRDVKSLHRVDAQIVKDELLKAGFILQTDSPLLRNKDDNHTINVFSSKIRGRTDRFLFKFIKPKNKS